MLEVIVSQHNPLPQLMAVVTSGHDEDNENDENDENNLDAPVM